MTENTIQLAMGEPYIISREESLWVLFKPAGMLIHAAEGNDLDLMHWLAEREPAAKGIAPCHRLDKATSGLIVGSVDAEERAVFGKQFAEGAVRKQYLALVYGVTHKKGRISRPLKKTSRSRPVAAVTRYRLLERLGGFSLLQVTPETGRKHQIRKHLQGIGHSVVGDKRYGPKPFRRVPHYPGRLWLHAATLTFPGGQSYEAELPKELAKHLELLRAGRKVAVVHGS